MKSTLQSSLKKEKMKILATGDWHIRNTVPEKRIDDYLNEQGKKLAWLIGLAAHEKCRFLIQPGDFFDSHKASDKLKRWAIRRLKFSKCPTILTIFGQHDLRYHSSDTKNTPLRVLEASGVVDIIGEAKEENVNFYGASWFEDIPKPLHQDSPKKDIHILVMHKMVIKNKKLWEGQEDAKFGNAFLRTHPFDLIVSGDNHGSFSISQGKRHLINCGSLMRMTTAQLNHKPCVYIYDTDDRSIGKHYIPIEPAEKVFDLSTIEKEEKENKELKAFVSRLKDNIKIDGLDYAKNLKNCIDENRKEISIETLEIIDECIIKNQKILVEKLS